MRRAAFVLALAAFWLSDGAQPFYRAALQSQAPNDFTPDWVAAHAWVHGGPHGAGAAAVLDGPAGNDYAASIGAPRVRLEAAYYVHPPTAFLVMIPLVPLGFRGAALAWIAISLGLLVFLAHRLAALLRDQDPKLPGPLLAALLLLWPPVLMNLQYGQWSLALAATIAAAHAAWERDDRQRSAGWIAVATALKLTPILLAPFLVLRDRRTLRGLALTLGLAAAISLGAGQAAAWRALFQHAGANVEAWQTYTTLSIRGLFARLFVGSPVATPLVAAPVAARLLTQGSVAALGLVALWSSRRGGSGRAAEGCRFALWNVFAVVDNPLAWAHYGILLLLPASLVWRAAAAQENAGRGRGMAGLVAGGLLALSVPNRTLYRLGGDLPLPPGRGLFLSVHLLGALLLFAGAALGARASRIDKPAALK
ncbi:MAG TPA: glycosyltransferase family 87 protein [Polyangia bacterium]|nr:glycosyltransferase family 87 protein [Polyangia bacterium]